MPGSNHAADNAEQPTRDGPQGAGVFAPPASQRAVFFPAGVVALDGGPDPVAGGVGESLVGGLSWPDQDGLHQVLDVVLDDDHKRNRTRNRPERLAAIRRLALNIVRLTDDRNSLRHAAECNRKILKAKARHTRCFADQIERRVLEEKPIPHAEKVFSIHEEHTRWITKGKAGKRAELGTWGPGRRL